MATTKRLVTKNGFEVPSVTTHEHYFTGVCRTKKRGYLVRSAAKKAAKYAAKQGYGNMRAYQCTMCNFWHIGHATEYNPKYKKNIKRIKSNDAL